MNENGIPMSKKQRAPRKPLASRLAGYGARRVSPTHEHTRRRYHFETLSYAVRGALRVERINALVARQGWNGRYEDGGREAFQTMCDQEGIDSPGLLRIAHLHLLSMALYLTAAASIFAFGISQAVKHELPFTLMSLGYLVVVPVLVALALRHGFCRWQIRERRFGGLGEYLRGR